MPDDDRVSRESYEGVLRDLQKYLELYYQHENRTVPDLKARVKELEARAGAADDYLLRYGFPPDYFVRVKNLCTRYNIRPEVERLREELEALRSKLEKLRDKYTEMEWKGMPGGSELRPSHVTDDLNRVLATRPKPRPYTKPEPDEPVNPEVPP